MAYMIRSAGSPGNDASRRPPVQAIEAETGIASRFGIVSNACAIQVAGSRSNSILPRRASVAISQQLMAETARGVSPLM